MLLSGHHCLCASDPPQGSAAAKKENRTGNVRVQVLGVGSIGPGLGGDGWAEGLLGALGTEGMG